MKRTVKIYSVSLDGISLSVTFDCRPSTWMRIKTSYVSVGGGVGQDLVVTSVAFTNPAFAKGWLEDLTSEVNGLLAQDEILVSQFESLVGEEEV